MMFKLVCLGLCLLHTLVDSRSIDTTVSADTSRSLQRMTSVTLILKLDWAPAETAWELRQVDGTMVDSREFGFYTDQYQLALHHIDVVEGTEYMLSIFDENGSGIKQGGYVTLAYGTSGPFDYSPSNLIARIEDFNDFERSVTFVSRLPKEVKPTPTVPPASPTPAPTTCEDKRWYGEVDPFTPTPIFTTTGVEFGSSEAICSSKTNYADCTNESREDCQWIFLTQGQRNGKCRVDPIAKCLQIGTCVCNTEDFQGGTSAGVLFHAPISVTARDISSNSKLVTYSESYKYPTVQNPKHPQDDTFFISEVDFTGRQLKYVFASKNPAMITSSKSIFFKLHYLYMDVPLVGMLWNGLGLKVSINTSGNTHVISINGRAYNLPKKLKMWTCTQIAISPDALYVAGVSIRRVISQETSPPSASSSLILGSFSGEMFDARVYGGKASLSLVQEVGARCAGPNDAATIKKNEDISTLFLQAECRNVDPMRYGPIPPGGVQTYASGPFATLWMRPEKDPLNDGEYVDVPEGFFDEEKYFQHAKLQSYQWERHYFENDMIAFVLDPYRMFSVDEVPEWSEKTFNNPCRYIHQSNNYWSYPLYAEGVVPKWTVEYYMERYGGAADAVFDLGTLYKNGGFDGYGYFTHEAYHEFHSMMVNTYGAAPSGWLQESSAEFAPVSTFPGIPVYMASVALAPAWPLSFGETDSARGADKNPHIFNAVLSLHDNIRGGHYYGTWLLWWFLSEHAGLPHLHGQMFSIDKTVEGFWQGKLFVLRMLLHNNDIDLGDAWIIFASHFRTWDFKNGALMKRVEKLDFDSIVSMDLVPPGTTLEGRKSQALIDATRGTNGVFVRGPDVFRPSPFSWNCLTSLNIAANRVIGITIRWDDGMGFAPNVSPSRIVDQHRGCDSDTRFYNSMVVLHNERTGLRQYWKIKGKNPSTRYIKTGSNGPVTMHILVMPTPPVDYSGGRSLEIDEKITPLPNYGYKYKVDILKIVPSGKSVSVPARKSFGIVQFDSSSAKGWFTSDCTCLDDPNDPDGGRLCLDPIFVK
ncbi:hypothetical protein MHU86_7565 [Fragilaria crotonensis]|nr:hypothetical protein MHU86_7565 [Fragilaria crotonensis]